ncbi:Hypp9725 [Branchiostoma lanceolatum]|uniref:Hypp9725 protein n=1 Tax=Branchiostoma lanceolatum TaxID=7740 RepID=A0A8S4MPG9_BRALA|nr:Hypp9725 [Branchiostoma lanceolatum]
MKLSFSEQTSPASRLRWHDIASAGRDTSGECPQLDSPARSYPRDDWLVHNTAVLILGAVADRIKHTDPDRARGLVRNLEENLGIHDPWHHRQLREALTGDELKRHYHVKATLLQALGNAEFDSSFDHLVSYVNNTDSPPLLRTSALSAIRKYKHAEAAGLLLDSALFDDEEHVRYHAALQYQRHPKALNLRKMKQDLANGLVNVSHYLDDVMSLANAMSQNPHLRKRRGVMEDVLDVLTGGIQFELKLPGVEWHRKIGSDDIGAEFGLIMKNNFDLDIRLSEGHAKLDIYDHAYARGWLGFFNMHIDFMDTGICFVGGIHYKVNILQDFNFKKMLELIKTWFRDVPAVIKDVKATIETFKNLFSHLANTTPEELFSAILDAIQTFPDRITAISRWARDTLERIGAYDNLPSFIEEARQVLLRVATLFNDVKKSVTELVNAIADSIHVVLPWGAEQIWQGLQTIFQEIRNLIRSPQIAAGNIAKAVYRYGYNGQVYEWSVPTTDKQPYWFHLGTQIEEILDDIQRVWRLLEVEAPAWVDGFVQHSTDVLEQAFSNETLSVLRGKVIDEFKAALDDLPNQIGPTADIIQPFLDAYTSTVGTVRRVKSCYNSLKEGFVLARSIIHKIFGPKASFRFPRRILDSETCGRGVYPSFGVGGKTYDSEGIDLEIREGRKVVAPFAGEITSISGGKIVIAMEDIKDMEAIIDSVDFETSIKEGQGGKTIASGNLTDILKDEDETPEEPEVDLDDSARVLDILQLLDEPDMRAIRDKLRSSTEQVQQYLNADPFKLPGTLTDDQLRWELHRRGKPAHGSRQQLLQMYTATTDNAEEDEYYNDKSWALFGDVLLVRSFRVLRTGLTFTLSLAVKLCAGSIETCLPPLHILRDVSFGIAHCDGTRNALSPIGQVLVTDLTLAQFEIELHYMSRSEMRRVLPAANLTDMNQLLRDLTRVLRVSYKEVVRMGTLW